MGLVSEDERGHLSAEAVFFLNRGEGGGWPRSLFSWDNNFFSSRQKRMRIDTRATQLIHTTPSYTHEFNVCTYRQKQIHTEPESMNITARPNTNKKRHGRKPSLQN